MNKKKIILFLAAMMICSFGACGKKLDDSVTDSVAEYSSKMETDTEEEPPVLAEDVDNSKLAWIGLSNSQFYMTKEDAESDIETIISKLSCELRFFSVKGTKTSDVECTDDTSVEAAIAALNDAGDEIEFYFAEPNRTECGIYMISRFEKGNETERTILYRGNASDSQAYIGIGRTFDSYDDMKSYADSEGAMYCQKGFNGWLQNRAAETDYGNDENIIELWHKKF